MIRSTIPSAVCLVASLACATSARDARIVPTRTLLSRDVVAPGPPLTVVVRYASRPSEAAGFTEVRLAPDGAAAADNTGRRVLADSAGVARFMGLRAGPYVLTFRSLGAFATRIAVTLPPACASRLEVYLVTQDCDLGDCPAPPRARAHFTTCARAA